ncbi:MAG: 1,4-dihydroxy-2-naphthoate octaprenyltransferase [Sphingobacteriia bacterium]|nr:1,4-dihydroxy-2-naphthoate octaprenyltransferase [Sphingobacteriia bacterium]NCC40933.1 1,4-dihydroxy-2-naphthoate octaprenyltransferase [Gammaproteobacteria bacterium]
MSSSATNVLRWITAARPRTLPLTVTPVLAGLALSVYETGQIQTVVAVITLMAAITIQIGTNLHNDVSDFERGIDTPERLGPPRATSQGWFTAKQMKRAAHLSFGLAFLLGIGLVWRGGWPILAIGIASLLGGYAYTSGPRPIAYGPFGEIHAMLFFGVAAVSGTYFLQTLTIGASAFTVGLALGLPAAAVLLLNNYRDLETDSRAGRRTLCHYIGREKTRFLYSLLLFGSIGVLLISLGFQLAWPVIAALPFAIKLIVRLYQGAIGVDINRMIGETAMYQLIITILLISGLFLDRPQ